MAEIKGEMIQIRTMAMETGTKLKTAIETKLLESMQQSMIDRVDGQMLSMTGCPGCDVRPQTRSNQPVLRLKP